MSENTITGTIITGDGEGRSIGFPTANLNTPPEHILYDYGVYAGYTTVNQDTLPAAIIVRPRHNKKTIETYILDFDHNIYGENITLHIQHYIRDWQQFNTLDDLKSQIKQDLVDIRNNLQA